MQRRVIQAGFAPPAHGYAQAIAVEGATRWVFVSGQVPLAADGTLPTGFDAQCRQAWANVEAQLQAGGMTLDDLVKVTIFLSDRAHIPTYRAIRREVLGDRLVALTTILPAIFDADWLLEIEAVAAA